MVKDENKGWWLTAKSGFDDLKTAYIGEKVTNRLVGIHCRHWCMWPLGMIGIVMKLRNLWFFYDAAKKKLVGRRLHCDIAALHVSHPSSPVWQDLGMLGPTFRVRYARVSRLRGGSCLLCSHFFSRSLTLLCLNSFFRHLPCCAVNFFSRALTLLCHYPAFCLPCCAPIFFRAHLLCEEK